MRWGWLVGLVVLWSGGGVRIAAASPAYAGGGSSPDGFTSLAAAGTNPEINSDIS